jgi:hypothetical protein
VGLFDGIDDVIDAAGKGLNAYWRHREEMKAIGAEKRIAIQALKQGGKTYSGIGTGDTAYSSAASSFQGFGYIAEPVANAASSIVSATSMAGAIKNGIAGVGAAANNAAGSLAAGGATVSTPLGQINVGTIAVVGIALAVVTVAAQRSAP